MGWMKGRIPAIAFAASIVFAGCRDPKRDPAAEAPPAAQVEHEQDLNVVAVDQPGQFAVVTAVEHDAASQLVVTGTVSPDVARTVPVVSLASGRVVDIRARLGDTVQKGQLLMRVRSDDVSGAFSDYRKAVADEILARTQLERAKDLYSHGAIALNDLQMAQDTEDKARVDVETSAEHLRLLGNDPDHPSGSRGNLCSGFGRDHRPGSHQCRGRARPVGSQSVSPFRTCRASGWSVTFTKTICRPCISATRPISA